MKRSPRELLVYTVQTLERLEAEKERASDAFREGMSHARSVGYDTDTLRVVLRLRKMSPERRKERRALEAIYLAALGLLDGDPLTDEARRRLDQADAPPAKPSPKPEPPTRDGAPPPPAASLPPPPQLSMQLKDPEEARKEGRTAAGAGKRIYDNPYPAGDPCRAAWDEGWCESKKSNGMDTPAAYQRRTEPPPKKSEKDPKAKDQKGNS